MDDIQTYIIIETILVATVASIFIFLLFPAYFLYYLAFDLYFELTFLYYFLLCSIVFSIPMLYYNFV